MRAWIYDLDAATMAGTSREREAIMPLCGNHADRIKVPVGWELDDRRAPAAVPAPAAPDPTDDLATSADAAPLFRPRMRPEPAEAPGPQHEREADLEATPASLLERAFRAAPTR